VHIITGFIELAKLHYTIFVNNGSKVTHFLVIYYRVIIH